MKTKITPYMVIIKIKKLGENWWWISHEFHELSASYAWWDWANPLLISTLFTEGQLMLVAKNSFWSRSFLDADFYASFDIEIYFTPLLKWAQDLFITGIEDFFKRELTISIHVLNLFIKDRGYLTTDFTRKWDLAPLPVLSLINCIAL